VKEKEKIFGSPIFNLLENEVNRESKRIQNKGVEEKWRAEKQRKGGHKV